MRLDEPRLVPREAFERVRPCLPVSARFDALWVAGDIGSLRRTTVAIVGSRAPSACGRRLAFETARAFGRAGLCVISGLALGIDGAAHAGAVGEGVPTIGVLGGGHCCFHPKRNRALAEEMIAKGGAVISPFPPQHAAYPPQFLQRNGIIAALADAVLVVEAAARSGALNTASWAADLSIPVFAFPGDVERPKVAGCLALLRDGATLVRNADDVLNDLGIAWTEPGTAGRGATGNGTGPLQGTLECALLRLLQEGELDVDRIVQRTGAAPNAVVAALSALEIEGLVERRPGQCFATL